MLALESLSKRFGETAAVEALSLVVEPGELLTLLGPSGCGKTTTLRMIAGFESPTAGVIRIAGREVTHLAPQRRGVGMVFQNYALFPHLSVAENVAFGLSAQGVARHEAARRAAEALALVGLGALGARRVQQLSGGQQQRVALARALAPEPPLLLLDEPLSNLDAALREHTRTELRALLKRVGITSIFVTHDREEAFALSDRVALLEGGRLQQLGTPAELYHTPANPFVASFLGRANLLPARVHAKDGARLVCELEGGARWSATAAQPLDGEAVLLLVRPEALALYLDAPGEGAAGSGGAALTGAVVERQFTGPTEMYRVRLDAGGELLVSAPTTGDAGAGEGSRVWVAPVGEGRVRAFPVSG